MREFPEPSLHLSELLNSLQGYDGLLTADPLIHRITLDNRLVRPGDLFLALVGGNTDAHRYIPDAIQRGAAAIVGTQALSGLSVPYIQVGEA